MPLSYIIFFSLSYYAVWFSCVYSAVYDYEWLGLLVAVCVSSLQILLVLLHKKNPRVLVLALLVFTSGCVVDSALSLMGAIQFFANPWSLAVAPPWIVGIWLSFSIVYSATWQPFLHRYLWTALFAFLGFPLAYGAGILLGAGLLSHGYLSCVLIGFIWSILLPSLNYLYLNYIVGDVNVVDS